uniref:Uncharacterized protein n=1 Tax=Knipowitschia caucasica TaxID=637954 RepID=A0AAV2IYK3_KNICA
MDVGVIEMRSPIPLVPAQHRSDQSVHVDWRAEQLPGTCVWGPLSPQHHIKPITAQLYQPSNFDCAPFRSPHANTQPPPALTRPVTATAGTDCRV